MRPANAELSRPDSGALAVSGKSRAHTQSAPSRRFRLTSMGDPGDRRGVTTRFDRQKVVAPMPGVPGTHSSFLPSQQ